MSSNNKNILHIAENNGGLDLVMMFSLPKQMIDKHLHAKEHQKVSSEPPAYTEQAGRARNMSERKSKVQKLLQKKSDVFPESQPKGQIIIDDEKGHQEEKRHQTVFRQKQKIEIKRNRQSIEHHNQASKNSFKSPQNREERERSRQNQNLMRPQSQSQPKPLHLKQANERRQQNLIRPPLPQPLRAPSIKPQPKSSLSPLLLQNKVNFQPRFNQLDSIYAVYKQWYSLKSASHPGFMIVNRYKCSEFGSCPSIEFEVKIPNPSQDDCAIGITYKPQDLLRMQRNNPVKRCMAYYFSSKNFNVGGSTYKETPISYGSETINKLIIDFKKKKFILFNQSEGTKILIKQIPQEFLSQDLFFFIELKNSGKIRIVQ